MINDEKRGEGVETSDYYGEATHDKSREHTYNNTFQHTMPSNSTSNSTDASDFDSDLRYDYIAKVILLGPSGCGKSCIMHRFVKGEWKVSSSQTIGVEFASKIVRVGQGSNLTRIKLQLWDTAGQERFRALTRSYYRGAAGVVLVYDTTNKSTFRQLGEFIQDVRSLTSSQVTMVACGNKMDLVADADRTWLVPQAEIRQFSQQNPDITVTTCSAKTGKGIEDVFDKIAAQLLTKIELGAIDPEDMNSGVQYGDVPRWDRSIRESKRRKKDKKGFSALSRFFSTRAGEQEAKSDDAKESKPSSSSNSSSRKNSSSSPLLRRASQGVATQEPIELENGASRRVDVTEPASSGCCY